MSVLARPLPSFFPLFFFFKIYHALFFSFQPLHSKVGLAYFRMLNSDKDEFHEMHEEYCQAPRHGGYVCRQWLRKQRRNEL